MEPVGAVADQAHAAVERLQAAVADPELNRGEYALFVLADRPGELDEWFEPGAGGPGESRVEPLDGLIGWEAVDVAQLAEQ